MAWVEVVGSEVMRFLKLVSRFGVALRKNVVYDRCWKCCRILIWSLFVLLIVVLVASSNCCNIIQEERRFLAVLYKTHSTTSTYLGYSVTSNLLRVSC